MCKQGCEQGCKYQTACFLRACAGKAMRYYPAFGVKSGPDALFTRFLSAANQVAEDIALDSRAFWERFVWFGVFLRLFFPPMKLPENNPKKAMNHEVCSCPHRTPDHV